MADASTIAAPESGPISVADLLQGAWNYVAGDAKSVSAGVLQDKLETFLTGKGVAAETAAERAALVQGYIAKGDSEAVAGLRVVLPNMTATEMLDSIVKNDETLKGVATALRAHPALADKIRIAAIKDPSILTGLEKMAKGEGSIDLAKFEEALRNENNRLILRQVFDKIAEDPDDSFNFATLETLAGHIAKNEQGKAVALLKTMGIDPTGGFGMADMFKFMKEFLKDPGQAIAGIIDKANAAGLIPADQLAEIKKYSAEFGNMMKPIADGLGQALPKDVMSRIEKFSTPVKDGELTNFSTEDFQARFKAAMDGLGRDYDNPAHVRAALIEMDPDMADKILEMDATALKNNFNTSVTEGTTLEALTAKAQAYYNSLRGGATMEASVGAMKPGGSATG